MSVCSELKDSQSSDPKEKEEIDEGESWSATHGLAGP